MVFVGLIGWMNECMNELLHWMSTIYSNTYKPGVIMDIPGHEMPDVMNDAD